MQSGNGLNSAKVEETRAALTVMAQQRGAGAQLPTVRQLRADLGVSLSTLNTALAVLEEQKVISRRQGSGIFVAAQAAHRHIALICDPAFLFNASPFWSLLIEQATIRTQEMNCHLALHFANMPPLYEPQQTLDSSPLHEALARDIANGRVQGALSVGLPHAVTRWIEGQGVPVVSFAGPSNYIIGQSQVALIQMAVAALARRDCKRVGLWMPLRANSEENQRRTARMTELFSGALAAHGVAYNPALSPRGVEQNEGHRAGAVEQGFALANQFLGEGSVFRPDGIVITDDMMAQGALMALARRKVKVGKKLQIATLSITGSPALLGWQDRLIRLEFDPMEMVQAMLDTLALLMKGNQPDWPQSAEASIGEVLPPEQHQFLQPRLILPHMD